MIEIEKDLVRWSRSRWIFAVAGLMVLQVGLLLASMRLDPSPAPPRPKIEFFGWEVNGWRGAEPAPVAKRPSIDEPLHFTFQKALPPGGAADWVELADPMLFAGPHWRGFSAQAWMIQRPWEPPPLRELPPIEFLSLAEARSAAPLEPASGQMPMNLAGPHLAPASPPLALPDPAPSLARESLLFVEGFEGRSPQASALSVQSFDDALGRSVVEALVDPDGLVLTARLIESSGSKKADLDAVAYARALRFSGSPPPGTDLPPGAEPEARRFAPGRLTFQWQARPAATTNNPAR